jgi:hypothetical protein
MIRHATRPTAAIAFALAASLGVLISTHAARADVTRAWLGANRDELVSTLGQPQEVRSDGRGGSILVYAAVRTLAEALDATETAPDDEGLYIGACLYFVDASGRIYGRLDALNL